MIKYYSLVCRLRIIFGKIRPGGITNKTRSKATCMSFPLVGNLSDPSIIKGHQKDSVFHEGKAYGLLRALACNKGPPGTFHFLLHQPSSY